MIPTPLMREVIVTLLYHITTLTHIMPFTKTTIKLVAMDVLYTVVDQWTMKRYNLSNMDVKGSYEQQGRTFVPPFFIYFLFDSLFLYACQTLYIFSVV